MRRMLVIALRAAVVVVLLRLFAIWLEERSSLPMTGQVEPAPVEPIGNRATSISSGQESAEKRESQEPLASDRYFGVTVRSETFDIEGDYGSFVLRAISEKNPAKALAAVELIRRCETVIGALNSAYRMRESRAVMIPDKLMGEVIDKTEMEQRRCQSISGDMRDSQLNLAWVATLGGATGGANALLRLVKYEPSADKLPTIASALVKDAAVGHLPSIDSAVVLGRKLELERIDRRAFEIVLERTADVPGLSSSAYRLENVPELVRRWMQVGQLGAEDEAAARAKADEIMANIQAPRQRQHF